MPPVNAMIFRRDIRHAERFTPPLYISLAG